MTQIKDPNIVLETITSRQAYLANTQPKKTSATKKETKAKFEPKPEGQARNMVYSDYNNRTREVFIDRMLETPEEWGRIARIARELGIHPHTASRWWCKYEETQEVPYKKSKENASESAFTYDHQECMRELLDNDPQLFAVDIINKLAEQFMDFKISKSQLNHHLKNTMLISVKKPTFEPEVRNSPANLQARYDWFME